ncbi:MAG: glycosyltransferase [Nanoarchaeota archaeon]
MKTNKLKLGMLSFYHPHLGGSGIVASRLMEAMARDGHEIHVIGYDGDSNPERMERLGIKLHNVGRIDYPCFKSEPFTWTLASKAINVDRIFNLDLLHAHYAIPHAASAFLTREQRASEGKHLPYIVTCHGSDIHTNGAKDDINPVLNLVLKRADAITYVSEDLRRFSNQVTDTGSNGNVVKNFVDTGDFFRLGEDTKSSFGIAQDSFVIGHASNFAPIKNVETFADLAKRMREADKLTGVSFLMCGDGADRYKLEARTRNDGTFPHFVFTGRLDQEQMRAAYSAMDLFCLTSKREGSPLTVLEAMACGLPIVASRYSSNLEFKNRAGFSFDFEDSESFEVFVDRLRGNVNLRKEMGSNALKIVESKFSLRKAVENYYKVYECVLRNKLKKKSDWKS